MRSKPYHNPVMAQEQEEHDYDFVAPVTLDSQCSVCLQTLQDPHIVSCCGHNFCRACISRIQRDRKPCPLCKQSAFTTMANQDLKRALTSSKVRCPYHDQGCEWVGELGKLDQHLNADPKPKRQLEGCQFTLLKCVDCKNHVRRHELAGHQNEHCPGRPYTCEYCEEYKSTFEGVANHWEECKCYLLPCPNNCNPSGSGIERQNMEHHVKEECPLTIVECIQAPGCKVKLRRKDMEHHVKEVCPLTIVECDLHYAGCGVKLPRKDMKGHMKKRSGAHISLLAAENQKLTKKLNALETLVTMLIVLVGLALAYKYVPLQQSMVDSLTKELSLIRAKFQTAYGDEIVPVDIKMCGFTKLKYKDTPWFSTPFYTHLYGYKMGLRVDANGRGDGKGTHISVFTTLMHGEFDTHLEWPFRGKVTIQLLSHVNMQHYTKTRTVLYTDATDDDVAGRVTVGERARGWGKPKFISHSELSNYRKNDCLNFRILVTSYNTLDQSMQL